jgi:hypothetical protein
MKRVLSALAGTVAGVALAAAASPLGRAVFAGITVTPVD